MLHNLILCLRPLDEIFVALAVMALWLLSSCSTIAHQPANPYPEDSMKISFCVAAMVLAFLTVSAAAQEKPTEIYQAAPELGSV
jgi:hypothetical protein